MKLWAVLREIETRKEAVCAKKVSNCFGGLCFVCHFLWTKSSISLGGKNATLSHIGSRECEYLT